MRILATAFILLACLSCKSVSKQNSFTKKNPTTPAAEAGDIVNVDSGVWELLLGE